MPAIKNSELLISFTPGPDKRILAAIAATARHLPATARKPEPEQIEAEALQPRPSRSDDPAYRKPIPA